EHIEEAGVHSGDSACSMPPHSLAKEIIAELERQAKIMAKKLGVIGLMNVQFAVQDSKVYVLEVNPRASRTVPFVAKAGGYPIASIAAKLMAGEPLSSFGLKGFSKKYIAVKEAVFPFARFANVDTILGPEMRSTGEVMGIDNSFPLAFAKSQLGAGCVLPLTGSAFISVRDSDKEHIYKAGKELIALGFRLVATGGTAAFLQKKGLKVEKINKVREGSPHIVDALENNEISLVINTTQGEKSLADSKSIRRTALTSHTPYYTTISGAEAVVKAISALKENDLEVQSIQKYIAQ
ncbi:MAG: carbamoyl-phosphate synthase large subunit, partial [Parvibaculales bacterium]